MTLTASINSAYTDRAVTHFTAWTGIRNNHERTSAHSRRFFCARSSMVGCVGASNDASELVADDASLTQPATLLTGINIGRPQSNHEAVIMSNIVSVPFYGDSLAIIEHNNSPFIPIKPVVRSLGLDWSAQFKKFKGNTSRWGVAFIATPTDSGFQETACLPLQKIHGWLQTIQPSRIKDPELKAKIIRYQNECDSVLWEHYRQSAQPAVPQLPAVSSHRQVIVTTLEPGKAPVVQQFSGNVRVVEEGVLHRFRQDLSAAHQLHRRRRCWIWLRGGRYE